jgi:ClpP class serine protease
MSYVIDAAIVARHRAGQVLALQLGGVCALRSGPSEVVHRRVRGGVIKPYLGRPNVPPAPRSQVAIVDVIGPLSQRAETLCGWVEGYDSLTARVVEELARAEVGAIMLRVDSPGGDVAGLELAIARIVAARDAARKPIVAWVEDCCASAAYWLAACVADAGVYAAPSAEVGSIGAYSLLRDDTAALAQQGVAITIVRSPAGKDAANPLGPVSDVALARESERVMAVSTRFASAIATARSIPIDAVQALDGAMLPAARAVGAGLIDAIASLDDAVIAAANRASERDPKPRKGTMAKQIKAADGPMDAPAESGGRATASEVSASATACATACTEAAAACDGGTADEAIAATVAMVAACEAALAVGESFLGGGSAPAAPPEPEGASAAIVALLTEIKSDRDRAKRDATIAAEAAERKALISGRVMAAEVRTWLESAPIADVRAACRVLPEAYDAGLAADVTVRAASGGDALTERERKICADTGCDPQRFAALKRARDAGGAR